jgi:serine/threonine protein kinase
VQHSNAVVTRHVERDVPCDAAALGASPEAALAIPVETAERTAVDDPDEATIAEVIADDAPTAIRPTPIPPDLAARAAGTAHDTARDPSPRPLGRIGKYQVFGRIARGAFGAVYSAYDPSLERHLALKLLRPNHLANHSIVQRFLQEARATARIAHPGIVTILDCGMVDTRHGPTAFIAMELLSGESLANRLSHIRRLAPSAACEIARQVASALEAAHQVDVLHRDLKPDNIFLVPDPAMPSGERVKVLDFGLAKLGTSGDTQLETVFGTPRYMSPEQGRSATQIDHRSDIYSLGCVLYELVTGRAPFDGDTRQLLDRHQRARPLRAGALATEITPQLDELIADMLAKDPMDRPQTMGAVQRSLRYAIDLPLEITQPARPSQSLIAPRPPHPAPPSRRLAAGTRPPASRPGGGDPAAAAQASVEVSMSSLAPNGPGDDVPLLEASDLLESDPSLGSVLGELEHQAPPRDSSMSGEVVVPAVMARLPEPLAEVARPVGPDHRQIWALTACIIVLGTVLVIALAANL